LGLVVVEEQACDQFATGADAHLVEDRLKVILDGVGGEVQTVGDVVGRVPLGDELRDESFPVGEAVGGGNQWCELGCWSRTNRRTEARTALEEALDIASRCNARALADRARTELRAAGGRSSGPQASGVSALTASELRVAELAAAGQSNPEIAQALYVTRKTVETHLGHVYRKLGVAGRGKLAGAMAGRTPTSERVSP
jgi:DNA-binding CsgD family transcriptional regulator